MPLTPLASPITWRPTAEMRLKLEQLRATFPEQRWGDVMGWLFEQPEVVAVIRRRMRLTSDVVDVIAEALS